MLIKTQDGAEVDINLDDHADEIAKHYSGKGMVLKTQAEIEKSISDATKSTHETWEKRASEILGESKPNGIAGLDWFKEKGTELVKKATAAPKEEPKEDPKTPSVKDDVEAARVSKLEQELAEMKSSREAEKTQSAQRAVDTGIKSSIRQLKLDGATDAEVSKRRVALETLVKQAYTWRLDEDLADLVPYNKDGQVAINPKTTMPFTMNELVEEEFPYMLAPKKSETPKVTGTQTRQDQIERAKSGDEGIRAASEDAIREEARKRGLVAGSPESKKFIQASLEISGLTK